MQVRWQRVLVVIALAAAAAVLAVATAKAAARVTDNAIVWALAGWVVPGDFGVFLLAGDAVLDGRSPYPSGELEPPPVAYYVYPPPLALATAPLAAISHPVTASFWTLLGFAAVIGGLLVLGVRDWRCHVVALLYTGTRDALEYGAIGTILLLLIAIAWRYRRRVPVAAAATAGAVVLKLFLWPLIVWHLLARRSATALAAAAGAAALALGSWAVIGFAGLRDYPRLLRDLTELEAAQTYSLFAFGRALGLPELVAQAAAVAVGVLLLVAAARAARAASDTDDAGERRALILTLAAALAATPILWVHYLVLLVLVVGLARPRFSPLWLVPLLGIVFEALGWYGGWADGSARAPASVLGLVAVVVAGSLYATGREPARRGRELFEGLRRPRPARASR
jgi:hypothetical protein